MTPETIAALFGGLVAVIGAVATVAAKRSERLSREVRELRREVRELRIQQRLSDRYIGRLLRQLDLNDLPVPRPPEGLFDDLDPDPDSDESPALRRTGRHERAATP